MEVQIILMDIEDNINGGPNHPNGHKDNINGGPNHSNGQRII